MFSFFPGLITGFHFIQFCLIMPKTEILSDTSTSFAIDCPHTCSCTPPYLVFHNYVFVWTNKAFHWEELNVTIVKESTFFGGFFHWDAQQSVICPMQSGHVLINIQYVHESKLSRYLYPVLRIDHVWSTEKGFIPILPEMILKLSWMWYIWYLLLCTKCNCENINMQICELSQQYAFSWLLCVSILKPSWLEMRTCNDLFSLTIQALLPHASGVHLHFSSLLLCILFTHFPGCVGSCLTVHLNV